MRTLLLAFILCIVIPAYEQTTKDVKVCSRTHTHCERRA
jgi:hypothetical protein